MLHRDSNKLHLFIAAAPLEFVALYVLEMLTTKKGIHFLLMMTDRYYELREGAPLKGKQSTGIAFGTH